MDHEARYLLEWWDETGNSGSFNASFKKSFLLPQVTNYQRIQSPATARTWTLGDRPVKEHAGIREESIIIHGESGFKVRVASTANGGEARISGKKSFEELNAFIREYEAEAAEKRHALRRSGTAPTLVMRAIDEGDVYVVDNLSLSPSKGVSDSKFITRYVLQMTTELRIDEAAANEPARPKPTRDWHQLMAGRIWASEWDASLAGTPAPVGSGAGSVPAWTQVAVEPRDTFPVSLTKKSPNTSLLWGASGILNDLDRVPREIDAVKVHVENLKIVLDRAALVSGKVGELMSLPASVTADIMDAAASAWNGIRRVWDGLSADVVKRHGRLLHRIESSVLAMRATATMMASFRGPENIAISPREPQGTAPSVLAAQSVTPSRPFVSTILRDDSWFEAGRQTGVTVFDLMDMNQSGSPFESADGSPVAAGDVVAVPSDSGVLSAPDDPYFTDFEWSIEDGDFVTHGLFPEDLAEVHGRPNLKQSFEVCAATIQGGNAAYPFFGFPKYIGTKSLLQSAGTMASQVAAAYRRDIRVSKVTDVVVVTRGDTATATAKISTIHGDVEQVGA